MSTAQTETTLINTRAGGVYIPPARLRMMQQQITDKNSAEYQRITWDALKKSINGLINKVFVNYLWPFVLISRIPLATLY